MNGKSMKPLGSKIRKFILDLIFPIKCLSCQAEGYWICSRCLNKIRLYGYNLCPICELENRNGSVCGYCKDSSNLDGLMIIFENNELSRKMIHFVKYNFIDDIFTYLKPKLSDYLNNNPSWRDFFVLVPVPLHRRRFLERGFNQSQIICDIIGETKGNKINNKLLKKIKYNKHQVGLSADRRRSNIVDSFKINLSVAIDHSNHIIIVDDVYTTGSTMEECAKQLKIYGYKSVWGLVLIKS